MKESMVVIGMNVRHLARSAAWSGQDVTGIGVLGFLDMPLEINYLSLMQDLGGLFPIDPDEFHNRIGRAALAQDVRSAAYSGGFENLPDIVADLQGRFELLGNSPQSLRQVRDPFRLAEVVADVGLEMPQLLPAGSRPDPGRKWLRKRIHSGAGYGIELWDEVVPDDPLTIVQEWIDGSAQSVSFVANGREAKIFAATHQLTGDPAFGASGFVYVGNLLLPQPDAHLLPKLEALANALTQTFGLVGLNGIDFVLADDRPIILEVNPRFSASMELVEDALSMSLFDWHIAGCRGESLPELPQRQDQDVYGSAIIIAQREGKLADTAAWPALGRRNVPYPGTPVVPGFPVCMVTAVGSDLEDCYARLQVQAKEVLQM